MISLKNICNFIPIKRYNETRDVSPINENELNNRGIAMKQQKKVALVLSGCGFKDGAEIHESVLTMLAIDRAGLSYHCFAPDILQNKVVDHYHQKEKDEKRNVLSESARIARGDIEPLADFNAEDFDAIIFPGGFGAATTLCSFASDGADFTIK